MGGERFGEVLEGRWNDERGLRERRVSRRVKDLEEELGDWCIDRVGKEVGVEWLEDCVGGKDLRRDRRGVSDRGGGDCLKEWLLDERLFKVESEFRRRLVRRRGR